MENCAHKHENLHRKENEEECSQRREKKSEFMIIYIRIQSYGNETRKRRWWNLALADFYLKLFVVSTNFKFFMRHYKFPKEKKVNSWRMSEKFSKNSKVFFVVVSTLSAVTVHVNELSDS